MDVGEQLPWLHDLTDDDGRPLNWRDTRRNRVVFFGHPRGCATCSSYARDLLDLRDALDQCDGDLWLIGDIADSPARSVTGVAGITGDAAHRLRKRCGLSPADAWVAVADRWGQIWQAAAPDDRHTLVDPAEVLKTTEFIAVQCPECETLDQPTGDWSTVR